MFYRVIYRKKNKQGEFIMNKYYDLVVRTVEGYGYLPIMYYYDGTRLLELYRGEFTKTPLEAAQVLENELNKIQEAEKCDT